MVISPESLGSIDLFARLPDQSRALIAARAADIRLRDGQWLIREGELPSYFVVMEGELVVVKEIAGQEHLVTRFRPGDSFGELPILIGSTEIASLRASGAARVMRLAPADFLELVVAEPSTHPHLRRTIDERVERLLDLAVETPLQRLKLIAPTWARTCYDLLDFLARNFVAFEWLDPSDPIAHPLIPATLRDDDEYPIVLLPDGDALRNPNRQQLADALGLQTHPDRDCYDVVIVGGGPAGLAAALYGASEGLSTALIERGGPGGQAGASSRIENYLGFPAGLSGEELSRRALSQATRFGAELVVARTVTGIEVDAQPYRLLLDDGSAVAACAVVLATGVTWRHLDVPGLNECLGRGVFYGSSPTEAQAVRGQDVYLVGGGNSAGQAAIFFSAFAGSVTLLVRGPALSASMSQYLIKQIEAKPNIGVRLHTDVTEVHGGWTLEAITVRDNETGAQATLPARALFIMIGAEAHTGWLPAEIARDPGGYILTGRDLQAEPSARARWRLEREPFLLETSVPGIFAAGDVRHGTVKRVASATGQGSMAIAFIHQYFADQEEQRARLRAATAPR